MRPHSLIDAHVLVRRLGMRCILPADRCDHSRAACPSGKVSGWGNRLKRRIPIMRIRMALWTWQFTQTRTVLRVICAGEAVKYYLLLEE